MKQINIVYRNLIIGIVIFGGLFMLMGFLVFPTKTDFLMGILMGILVAVVLSVHLYVTIDKALDMEEKRAVAYMKSMTLLRILLMSGAIVAALCLHEIFNPLGVILGILTLKFGAYIQPLINRITNGGADIDRKVKG